MSWNIIINQQNLKQNTTQSAVSDVTVGAIQKYIHRHF